MIIDKFIELEYLMRSWLPLILFFFKFHLNKIILEIIYNHKVLNDQLNSNVIKN